MLRRFLFALLWLAYAVSVQTENQVIGTVELILDGEAQTYTIPSKEAHPASVLLLENWSQPLDGYDISADPGEISLTGIEAGRDDDVPFSGTFSGVLRRDEETKTVQGASFEVDRVPFVDPLSW